MTKEHDYGKILSDIKQLRTSLQEIESIMNREICSKSGSINSHFDFKRSILSCKGDDENMDQFIQIKGIFN